MLHTAIKYLIGIGLLISIFGFELFPYHQANATSNNRELLNLNPMLPSCENQLFSFFYLLQPDTSKKTTSNADTGFARTTVPSGDADALVLNATYSPGAYDFYVLFSQNWVAPEASDYQIVIKEYPGRGVNIVLAIELNEVQLVYRQLRPTYEALHWLATAAANYLSNYIAQGNHLLGVDANGNLIDPKKTDATRRIKTPFDIY